MRNESNFANVYEYDNAALEADFRCDCGGDAFYIFHSGKQRKSLFGNISIGKRKGQLILQCSCSQCLKRYTLFDSTKDGASPEGTPIYEFSPVEIAGEKIFDIKLKFNFAEENFKTDQFEMFFLEVKVPGVDKYMSLCEQ